MVAQMVARLSTAAVTLAVCGAAWGQQAKPNILVIWGDDIGIANVSAYSDGVICVRMSNAPLTRRVFFRIRFTPYEGSHLENYP